MNRYSIGAILHYEISRARRTWLQSIAGPVISTVLYFVVFGAAMDFPLKGTAGISYGAFIVPGLTLLTVVTQSVSNAAFGIYMPRYSGAIYEVLSAPLLPAEIIVGYVGAATIKSVVLGLLIVLTARLIVPFEIANPFCALAILILTALSFSLLGFITGLCVDGWDRLQLVPSLIITPLTFLGGCFYSLSVLPSGWQTLSFMNPLAYVVDLFRWSFYATSVFNPAIDFMLLIIFLMCCLGVVRLILRSGYRLQI
jgi:ABC-2 type transport system permease protein